MEIKEVEIGSLKLAEYNPREISEFMLEKLCNSITEFGFVEPVVINSDLVVIGGHQRIEAAKKLGMTTVPTVTVNLDKQAEIKLNIALNKITGEFDQKKLIDILENLSDISLTGFTDSELMFLQDTVDPNFQSNDEVGGETGGELPTGDISPENYVITFLTDNMEIYNELHDYFGGKAEHDTTKLLELVNFSKGLTDEN